MEKRKMSDEMLERVEEQRDFVKGHFTEESKNKYETIAGKLYLLQSILDNKFYQKDETWELQSLGITFGDALVQELNLEWIEVEDEYGIDPALIHKESSVFLFPLTMISKRIENDEEVDVSDLFNGVCKLATEQIKNNLETK